MVIPSVPRPLNPALLAAGMEPGNPPSRLQALTSGLAQGDDRAWSEFHRDYGAGLFRYLLACTRGDDSLASEALQQSYLRIARHARPCASEPEFIGWLRIVARTALGDCRRRQHSFWNLLRRRAADECDEPEVRDHEEQLLNALDAALAQIAPESRALLEAKYLAGARVCLIATNLGLSEKAVESRLTRARGELRARLVSLLSNHEHRA